ncbi:sodium-dependent proline transporter-like [Physella acuta]|uniref:sodium-dependent proline transporter-like n=1 Tax=Physella acuta TaxID=109671 RepID=UPI0027DADF22|nr:sodium-dependent proline transporter-like [Physella acuta]XP_059169665.1 sodium-dependent proline transporter-like [Physella acuta]
MEDESDSDVSLAFTNSSLAYTISESELVSDWLNGKTPSSQKDDKTDGDSDKSTFSQSNCLGKVEYVISLLGHSFGLGNIWRFPYLCFRNKGGSFLVPYILLVCFVGMPLVFLETTLGQFTSKGPAKCWDFAPIFKGLGVAMIVTSILISIYYHMVIAWVQFYLCASFTSKLPWSECGRTAWSTKDCSLKWPVVTCKDGVKFVNGTCIQDKNIVGVWNLTVFYDTVGEKPVSASEKYWNNNVLALSSGIFKPDSLRWQLSLSLLLAWSITFICLLKGIKSKGKVLYFTCLAPYVILGILFFRGVTLDTAGSGILFYIVPDIDEITKSRVWLDALSQVFYSLGPTWGGLITLSSYKRFHNNAFRDSMIVSCGNTVLSLVGGLVVFTYLGQLAGQLHLDIHKAVAPGPGLAFIVYSSAVLHLPAPPFWSVVLFLLLMVLEMDTRFSVVATVLTSVIDQRPHYKQRKVVLIFLLCSTMFILSLPLATNGGMYIFTLMDTYIGSWSLMVSGLTELVAVTYVYGCNRLYQDMTIMFGTEPSLCWKVLWMCVTPLIIIVIFFYSCVDNPATTYGSYVYPTAAEVIGWLIMAASIIWIPVCALYKIIKEDEGITLMEKIKLQSIPNKYWGPSLVKHRRQVTYVKDFVLDPEGDKLRLAYVNKAFTLESSYSTYCDNGTLNSYPSTTTFSFDDHPMFLSNVSLETSV